MTARRYRHGSKLLVMTFLTAFAPWGVGAALAHGSEAHAPSGGQQTEAKDGNGMAVSMPTRHEQANVILAMPMMNSERGMTLFVEKGCVACHAVNGVGGHDAASLDAHDMDQLMNPFDFAAKMWDMAPYMIAAQEEALGEQLRFTGAELADIIAFVHDEEMQHHLTEAMIPPRVQKMMHHSHAPASGVDEHADEIGHGHGKGQAEDHDE